MEPNALRLAQDEWMREREAALRYMQSQQQPSFYQNLLGVLQGAHDRFVGPPTVSGSIGQVLSAIPAGRMFAPTALPRQMAPPQSMSGVVSREPWELAAEEINRHWMQIPAAQRNAMRRTSEMRRQMGLEPTPTGDARTDAVIQAIEEALRYAPGR